MHVIITQKEILFFKKQINYKLNFLLCKKIGFVSFFLCPKCCGYKYILVAIEYAF